MSTEGQKYPDRPPYLAEGTYRFKIKAIRKHQKQGERGPKLFAIVEGTVEAAQPGSKTPAGEAVVMFNVLTKGGKVDLGELVSALDDEHFGDGTAADLDALIDAKHEGEVVRIKAESILIGMNKDWPFTKYAFKAA